MFSWLSNILRSVFTKGRNYLPALFISIAAFAAVEEARWAVVAAIGCGILLSFFTFSNTKNLSVQLLGVGTVILIGPVALPILTFLGLVSSLGIGVAINCAVVIALLSEWAPKLGLITSSPAFASAVGAIVAPLAASLALATASQPDKRLNTILLAIGMALVWLLVIWTICQFQWIGADVFSNPIFRMGMVVLFVALTYSKIDISPPIIKKGDLALAMSLLLTSFLIAAQISRGEAAKSVVFDEAHGDWASVSLPLGPNDFGRNTTYSWRAIANMLPIANVPVVKHSQQGQFPALTNDQLYVVKMPLESIEPQYGAEILHWVSSGGRLLVVADHTDLFDTTQNLNNFLAPTGVKISPTAVFNRYGQPPTVPRSSWGGPTWLQKSSDHRYLTGASFESLPWWTLPLHTYGKSFAEQAVYFKPNRFGYFVPDLAQTYSNHIAVAMLSHGNGSIQIWLDSTHWSTFAAFQSNYQDAFWQTINRSGFNLAPKIYAVSLALISLLGIIFLLKVQYSRILVFLLTIAMGSMLGAAASVRLVDSSPPKKMQITSAVLGPTASSELLAPIVESPERNYSRALTALQKWTPLRMRPSIEEEDKYSSKAVLLIDPSTETLTNASEILEKILSGKRITILSNSRLLTTTDQQKWFSDLGFVMRSERGLSEERDASSDQLGRRQANLSRRTILRFSPIGSSPWVETESSHLAQTFVPRSALNRSNSEIGALILSSRSDQFSDAAMGDVWDGVPADDLAKERESELAQLVLGDSAVSIIAGKTTKNEIPRTQLTQLSISLLNRYLIVAQGKLVAEGTLAKKSSQVELSFSETPQASVWRLRNDVGRFIADCTLDAKTEYCSKTLVDSKLVEWFVMPKFDQRGQINRLELIQEGRFSGLQHGVNILLE